MERKKGIVQKMLNIRKYLFDDPVVRQLSKTIDNPRVERVLKHFSSWIDTMVEYRPDLETYGFDLIQPPAVTTRIGEGDCQDITALTASVLDSLNISFRLATGLLTTGDKHIWIEIKDNKRCYIFDGTAPVHVMIPDCDFEKGYSELDNRKILERTEWI